MGKTKTLTYKKTPSKLVMAAIIALLFIINTSKISAQKYLHLNEENSLRFEQKHYKDSNQHFNIKPFVQSNYLAEDSNLLLNNKLPIINTIANNNLIHKEKNNLQISINPIIDVVSEIDINNKEAFEDYKLGMSIAASLGKKLHFGFDGFYGLASFSEQESLFIDSTQVIRAYGKIISKKSQSLFDYYNISTYLSYQPYDFLNLQVGIGKNFFGEGYRSLFLSNNSNNYPFAKASVDIWRFKYIWLVGALKDPDSKFVNKTFKNKLLFSHYLSWNATKFLNLNFFEAIVSNPVDSMGVNYFNINYLNPVIFFRPVEFAGGSADNALLGFGVKLKIYKKYQIYSQFLIDEFVFAEIKNNKQWWGNKFGIQAGIKVFDFANINNLFARFEYNMVRPYTYSHSNSIMCYGNHYQPLAHAEGANFTELIFQTYYLKNRYSLNFKAIYTESGQDIDNISYGQNIYKSYKLRKSGYGNNLKQGYLSKLINVELTNSYILNPKMNLAVQVSINYRKQKFYQQNYSNFYFSVGIRTFFDN